MFFLLASQLLMELRMEDWEIKDTDIHFFCFFSRSDERDWIGFDQDVYETQKHWEQAQTVHNVRLFNYFVFHKLISWIANKYYVLYALTVWRTCVCVCAGLSWITWSLLWNWRLKSGKRLPVSWIKTMPKVSTSFRMWYNQNSTDY